MSPLTVPASTLPRTSVSRTLPLIVPISHVGRHVAPTKSPENVLTSSRAVTSFDVDVTALSAHLDLARACHAPEISPDRALASTRTPNGTDTSKRVSPPRRRRSDLDIHSRR